MTKEFNIWEGIYATFSDAKYDAVGPGFSGDIYCARTLNAAHLCLTALNANKPIPSFYKQRSTLLPPVVTMMLENKNLLRILDLGGGLGIGYITLAESILNYDQLIDYTIIEVPEVCATGRELFSEKITYLNSLPVQRKFDLVHSASTLQYIENWQQVLKALTDYDAKYILLSDVFAGESISTFVTLQLLW